MPRSGAIVVEVRERERLRRRWMCVQRLNSRCAHNSMAPTCWTRIDYGICPIGTTAVTVRNFRRMARRRVFCTFPVRNSCLSELPRRVHHSPHGQDGDRSQKRCRYNPYIGESPLCTGRAVNCRVSALDVAQGGGYRFGCARMMHYPREMTRRRVTPARSAGDRGLTEQLRSLADVHRGVVRHSGDREYEFTDLLGDGLERLEVDLAPCGGWRCRWVSLWRLRLVRLPAFRVPLCHSRGGTQSRPCCDTARALISRPGADIGRGAAGVGKRAESS